MYTRNKYLKDTKAFQVTVELHKPSLAINVLISSVSIYCCQCQRTNLHSGNQESFAGLTVVKTYKPNVRASEYPTLDTRPKDAVVRLFTIGLSQWLQRLDGFQAETLDGLEDNPDFWNMDFEDDEDVKPVVDSPSNGKHIDLRIQCCT